MPKESSSGFTLRYLRSDEYPIWDALVADSDQGSVFCRSWWLNAVEGEVKVLGLFEDGVLCAGMPLYFTRRAGLKVCIMPKLTQTWGVLLLKTAGNQSALLSREMRILQEFANRVRTYTFFFQGFHPSLQNWLPFYWNGFRQTSRFTYVIEGISDLRRVWDNMKPELRTKIRKAEKQGLSVTPGDPENVLDAMRKSFSRQALSSPVSRAHLVRVANAASENGAGICLSAVDSAGRVHAATFVAWDQHRAYYVAGGVDPEGRISGAGPLLLWRSICFAAERSRAFDFMGSMLEPVCRYNSTFGAMQVPYSQVYKFPLAARIYLSAQGKV